MAQGIGAKSEQYNTGVPLRQDCLGSAGWRDQRGREAVDQEVGVLSGGEGGPGDVARCSGH